MGLELEYFLVRQREDGSIELADKLDTLEKPCYDITGLTRQYDFLTTVSKYANELGWGNYANDHEDANGQFEQNFTYDDALTPATARSSSATWCTRSPSSAGMIATFMPKPFSTPHRQRLPLPHVALGRTRRTSSSTRPTRAGSACPRPRTTSSAACASTHAPTAPSRRPP